MALACISVSIPPLFSFLNLSFSDSLPTRSSFFLDFGTSERVQKSSWKKVEGGFVKGLLEYALVFPPSINTP
jgi:hypothetical protein